VKLLGFEIKRARSLSPADGGRGWFRLFASESYPGAFQQDVRVDLATAQANHAVFSCQTLIASDIKKLRIKIVELGENGIWTERRTSPYRTLLRKPNSYQNRIQFIESWVLSKLRTGNTYVLKVRNNAGMVSGLHVLDPDLVTPLVSDSGEVFYQLDADRLAGISEQVAVPAREIIHDRFNCLYHPLVGLPPIFAAGLAAMQGNAIQKANTLVFQNGGRPSGILIAPGNVSDEDAKALSEYWQTNYSGTGTGKTAVLGGGLKYEPLVVKAVDAQVIEQLKWTAEVVCSTYHVPGFMVGIGAPPSGESVEARTIGYYSQCLQAHIEDIELCLDEGLGFGENAGTEFDTTGLIRMDSVAKVEAVAKKKGILTLDEQRRELDEAPLPEGGGTVYLQQQDHSLAAIAARDEKLIEDAKALPPVPANDPEPVDDQPTEEERAAFKALLRERIRERVNA
jgi:HK97 family phage portal protein